MGDALEAANPAIKTVLTKCMRQPATTLAVQLAAIQAFRRMEVTDEVHSSPFYADVGVLFSHKVYRDNNGPVSLPRFAPTFNGSACTPRGLCRSAWQLT